MSVPYVPLRVFSSFTMLEGAIEPKAIAKQAAKLGFPAVALNDRNGLYAAMAFGEACMEAGVQPVIGAMLGVARPEDIGPDNVLLSQNISELSVYKRERGQVRDSYRRGWLLTFWDSVRLF